MPPVGLGTSGPIIVPGTDYFETARERFEERMESPGETFAEKLQQGTTGPAPALTTDDDGNVQIESPEGFGDVNRGIVDVLGGNPEQFEQFNEGARETQTSPREFVAWVVGLLVVVGVALVVFNAFIGGFAEGLAQR